jgi:hypothetical protein
MGKLFFMQFLKQIYKKEETASKRKGKFLSLPFETASSCQLFISMRQTISCHHPTILSL